MKYPALNPHEELMLSYRPYAAAEKWLKHRFSAWSSFKTWFALTLMVMFFFFGGMGFVLKTIINILIGQVSSSAAAAGLGASEAPVLWTIFAFFGLCATASSVIYLAPPSFIGINANGLRLHWKKKLINMSGPLITWDKLSNIHIFRPPGKTTPQDYWICFQSGSQTLLKLKLGAIPTMEEREKLLMSIERWAPDVACAAEVLEVLAPPQDHSYTELWLQALTAPPKRERLTPLTSGGQLQEARYTIIAPLGVGGQGTAYSATHASGEGKQEIVVLKESILPVYVDANVRRQALEKFQNEAAMLRKLDHPQVVKLLNFFIEDHRSYLVLEHIDGKSLRDYVANHGAMPESKVLNLAGQMCDILAYLHGLSPPVVHRDFTPDNLILNTDGTLKLIDFMVAQQTESGTTGTVVGKHAYLPPEQFRGKPTTQSDIYALGATLYFLLTGEDPQPITSSHPILINESVSGSLDQIVARATTLDPLQRYWDIATLKADLAGVEDLVGAPIE